MNRILTLKEGAEIKLKEKGSVFIAKSFRTESLDGTENILRNLRKEFHDASHIPFGFLLAGGQYRHSDDGEPSGSAGVRIFNAIRHYGLSNVLVTVIRYFGGIKLGVSLLGKTFHNAAEQVLEKSEKVALIEVRKFSISYSYDLTQPVHHILKSNNVKIIRTYYDDLPVITGFIESSVIEKLKDDLSDLTPAFIDLSLSDEVYYI